MWKWLRKLTGRTEPDSPEFLALRAEYPVIDDATHAFIGTFGPAFTNTPQGHIATDIAGAACLSGFTLLQQAGVPPALPAGTVLLSEEMNQELEKLFRFIGVAAYQVQLPVQSPFVDIPPEHQPMFEVPELVAKLRGPYENACKTAGVKPEFHSYVGILTAMKLVKAGDQMRLLHHEIGRSIVAAYLTAGAKTIP